MMRSNFTRGLIIGGIIGASVSMAMNSDMMNGRSGRKMKRNSMDLMRKSGSLISDVIELFR
ncbi:MAG: YtxH domain-containing protein [Clostridiaceae bacterium]|nr:YtxH domain-containing protein [Clostridiaceae bacterium]